MALDLVCICCKVFFFFLFFFQFLPLSVYEVVWLLRVHAVKFFLCSYMTSEEIYLLLLWFTFLPYSSLPHLFTFLQCSCMIPEDTSLLYLSTLQ